MTRRGRAWGWASRALPARVESKWYATAQNIMACTHPVSARGTTGSRVGFSEIQDQSVAASFNPTSAWAPWSPSLVHRRSRGKQRSAAASFNMACGMLGLEVCCFLRLDECRGTTGKQRQGQQTSASYAACWMGSGSGSRWPGTGALGPPSSVHKRRLGWDWWNCRNYGVLLGTSRPSACTFAQWRPYRVYYTHCPDIGAILRPEGRRHWDDDTRNAEDASQPTDPSSDTELNGKHDRA